jgi:serine/threonine protein kinase
MEYLPHGDLQSYLRSALPEDQVRKIIQQVLEGVKFMHDSQIAHRDLKPGVRTPHYSLTAIPNRFSRTF